MMKLWGLLTFWMPSIRFSPRIVVLSFAVTILLGGLVLTLPGMVKSGIQGNSFSDGIFMSTSAVCVTGLAVRDLAGYSFLGQFVLLLLIQVGGIGIITFGKLALLAGSRRLSFDQRDTIAGLHGALPHLSPRTVLSQVFLYTLVCESIGAILLWPGFMQYSSPVESLWMAIFHSVSAFCNAGFGLRGDNLCMFRDDVWINLIIMGLIVAGGLGFIVTADLRQWVSSRLKKRDWRLSLHTKAVVVTTLILLGFGTLLIWALQGFPGMRDQGGILSAAFLSVTSRTAGFNTIDLANLCDATLLVVIVLMFIGGSPGSTAGGIKTTVVATLFAMVRARWRNRPGAELAGRQISPGVVTKAMATTLIMGLIVLIGFMLLALAQHGFDTHSKAKSDGIALLFEVVSALGTVGLSVNVTPTLNEYGRIVIIACMFIGRLGPLLLAESLMSGRKRLEYSLPHEDPIIG